MQLKEAKQDFAAAQKFEKEAKEEERLALGSSRKFETNLQKSQEKIRVGLLLQQDLFLDRKAKDLKKQIDEFQNSSKRYRSQAEKLKIQAQK